MLALISQLSFASGQQVCSCTPTIYRWKLDFSSSCNFGRDVEQPSIGIEIGRDFGVTNAICGVSTVNPSDDGNNLIPVKITKFQFVELDRNGSDIKSEGAGPISLQDGDIIQYNSETAIGTEIPARMTAFVFAENSQGDEIQLQWTVVFSNRCETIPFKDGDSLGWLVFVSTRTCDYVCVLSQ